MRRASGRLPVAAVACCLVLAFAEAALAGGLLCYPRDELFAGLAARHGERPAFAGVTADGRLLEVLVAPDGSFTAFLSLPDGLACPLAAGEGWRATSSQPADPET